MNIKGNTRIEGEAVVESLPISASSLSTLVEVGGLLHKRQFSDIVLQPKEAYIPGLSVSFPSIFNLNTESLDYNNRSLVVSLKNQLAGTAFLAPVAMNGTPAFRRIVKSDLTDAGVAFVDELSIFKIVQYNGDVNTFSNVGGYLETAKNTPVSSGTGNIISFGHQSYKTSIFSTSNKNGTSFIRVDGDGGIGDWRELYHSGNIEQVISNRFLPLSGGTLNGGGNIDGQGNLTLKQVPTANATGVWWDNLEGSKRIAGIGTLTNGNTLVGSFIGWGESPWDATTSLFVNSNGVFYKDKPVWHEGNLNTNDLVRNIGTSYVANINANKLNKVNSVSALELPNGNNNTNFPGNIYGTFTRLVTNSFITDIIGSNDNELIYRTFYHSGGANGENSIWRKVWDDKNLINPATQDWVTTQGFSKQTLTAGDNIQINGNVISATDTIAQSGGLSMLIAGIDNVGRVWTSKTLNDWLSTKAKPILELTSQEGIKVKDWNTAASGQYSVSIGHSSSATKYNSLALMQGANADGLSSISIGEYSQALGYRSIAIGSYVNSINESYSFGFGVTNTQNGCVALGEYNSDIAFGDGMQRTNNSETPLLVVGNGISPMIRSNAQVLYRDGSTRNYGRQYYDETMRSTIDFTKDNTLADVKYVKENGGGSLPNNPFLNVASNGFAGDTVDNPKFVGTTPDDLEVVVIFLERGVGLNMWIKASSNGTKGTLYGVYLKQYNKILLRGYYRNTNTGQVNNTSMLFDTASKQTLFMSSMPLDLKYVLLGNFIDAQGGLILFNPR
ncbi:MAG: hypothetical protein LBE34_12590 [Flavobacteriaceae bacterium]|jgi:hypothetical protein|nr:hypothetical protein [Flavobacteriaceae bacterium]